MPRFPTRRSFIEQGTLALLASSARLAPGQATQGGGKEIGATATQNQAAVACSQREAGLAAGEALRRGGNAIDAAVAALLVQCVIEPHNVGLGGYGGSLVYFQAKTGRVQAIDFDARAPRAVDPSKLNSANQAHGYLSLGVPGVVAGIELALREFGTLDFRTLAEPAVALAENGVLLAPGMAQSIQDRLATTDPISQRALFPRGIPVAGEKWVQIDLAKLLRRLGEEGLTSFYTGEIAEVISRQVAANGGVLATEDFRNFRAKVVEPLHIEYRGCDLYTPPLPSGGLTSLTILKTLEQFDVPKLPPWGARYIELFAGASNLAWHERRQFFGDPEFVAVPVDELLSKRRAAKRAEQLRQGMPSSSVPASGPSHTVNIVVADGNRDLVSLTATHGDHFGSRVAIDGLGLLLGHAMSRFDLQADSPNFPAAGKRPQHNMSPLVVLRDGQPFGGLGLPGGTKIVTVTAQLAVSLIDFRATPQQVVTAPRIHTEGQAPIQVTSDTPPDVVQQLRDGGHEVEVVDKLGVGANAVVLNAATGQIESAASKGSTGAMVFR